jgi:hypothetical protein
VTLYDEDEQEKINFLEMLTVTFGKIVNRKIIFRFLRITTEPLNIF